MAGAKRRNHSTREADEDRDDAREHRDTPVEPHVVDARKTRRQNRGESAMEQRRHQQSRRGADEAKQRALDDPLPDQSRVTGPDRRAQRRSRELVSRTRDNCSTTRLAVEVRNSKATAARRIRSAGRTSAVITSRAGIAVMPAGPLLPNNAIAVCFRSGALRARAVPSAPACSGVTPGRRRAMAENIIRLMTPPGRFTGTTVSRVHACVSRSGNAKPSGMTPMTV